MVAALFLSSGSILPFYIIAHDHARQAARAGLCRREEQQFWQGADLSGTHDPDISGRFRTSTGARRHRSYVTTENRSLANETINFAKTEAVE